MANMVRTQIYISASSKRELKKLSKQTGEKNSELIRKAIEQFINTFKKSKQNQVFDQAFGMWKNHENLSDIKALRKELDRKF